MGIDVERQDVCGTGARRRESQDSRPGADIGHALTTQVEAVDEFREIFAAEKEARMEHCGRDAQTEACRRDRPNTSAAEDNVIGRPLLRQYGWWATMADQNRSQ